MRPGDSCRATGRAIPLRPCPHDHSATHASQREITPPPPVKTRNPKQKWRLHIPYCTSHWRAVVVEVNRPRNRITVLWTTQRPANDPNQTPKSIELDSKSNVFATQWGAMNIQYSSTLDWRGFVCKGDKRLAFPPTVIPGRPQKIGYTVDGGSGRGYMAPFRPGIGDFLCRTVRHSHSPLSVCRTYTALCNLE